MAFENFSTCKKFSSFQKCAYEAKVFRRLRTTPRGSAPRPQRFFENNRLKLLCFRSKLSRGSVVAFCSLLFSRIACQGSRPPSADGDAETFPLKVPGPQKLLSIIAQVKSGVWSRTSLIRRQKVYTQAQNSVCDSRFFCELFFLKEKYG